MTAIRPFGDSRSKPILLAATLVCLLAALVEGYQTRRRVADASAWVTHTQEVELAIVACELALARGDSAALAAAEAAVGRLTLDNPRQQQNVARVEALSTAAPGLPRERLESSFASMRAEEERLMALRVAESGAAQARSALVFVVAVALALLFGVAAFAVLESQRRATAVAHEMAARQHALLEAIVESVQDGIVAVDASRRAIAINATARAMVGAAFPRDRVPEDWRPALTAT